MAAQRARVALVTGGAGFIGSNLVERLLGERDLTVRIFDDLSRRGVAANLAWLQSLAPAGRSRLEFVQGNVCHAAAVQAAARGATEIYHLAAQVAVTTSVEDPRSDLETNVFGTFNVLEAARRAAQAPFLLFTSTNKVYGSLHGVPVEIDGTRYRAIDPQFEGVGEDEPLDFHSPYGCSKGAADQYVRDYARIYDLPSVVFRMSCIAGPRQFGTEDQGWVAHFLYSVLEGRRLTLYGDGFQVRDVLHVTDLVEAMVAARNASARTAGEIYNLGGGPSRTASVIEMLRVIEREAGISAQLKYSAVRPGDQPLYVSDTAKFAEHTGWTAKRSLSQTVAAIHEFWRENRELLEEHRRPEAPALTPELVQEVA